MSQTLKDFLRDRELTYSFLYYKILQMNSKHFDELYSIVLSKLTEEERRKRTEEDGMVYVFDILHKTMWKTIEEYYIGFIEFLDALDKAIEDIRKEETGEELDEDLPF